MASFLGEELFQISGQGPPPPKDFYQRVITKDEIIWRSWKISLRLGSQGAPPKELIIPHHDFLQQKVLQHQLSFVFGERILEYTRSLCQGKIDYLERLPDDIMLQIMSYLHLKDTTILAQVSHRFRKLCKSEMFWEQTVRNSVGYTNDMEGMASFIGWRETFFTFFHKSKSKVHQQSN